MIYESMVMFLAGDTGLGSGLDPHNAIYIAAGIS